jgi:hypothetical protein
MIKAKKGLIITLFAAMMVFAFGATTAFAGIDGSHTFSTTDEDYVKYLVKPTCTTDGYAIVTCSNKEHGVDCTATKNVKLSKTGHHRTDNIIVTAKEYADELVKEGRWSQEEADEWMLNNGNKICTGEVGVCGDCGAFLQRVNNEPTDPSLFYAYSKTVHTPPPAKDMKACADSFTCQVCGKEGVTSDQYNADTSAAYHNNPEHQVAGTPFTAHAITGVGTAVVTEYTCEACEEVVKTKTTYTGGATVNSFASLHTTTPVVVTEPTCETPGRTNNVCTKCGEIISYEETKALGHNWVEGTTAATEKEGAYKYEYCDRCLDADGAPTTWKDANGKATHNKEQAKYVQVSLPLEHNITVAEVAPKNCTDNTWIEVTCSNPGCTAGGTALVNDKDQVQKIGDKYYYNFGGQKMVEVPFVEAEGHTWGDAKTIVEATCETKGVEGRTCTTCNAVYHDTVRDIGKALGHTPLVEVVAPTCGTEGYTHSTCTVCGKALDKDGKTATSETMFWDETKPVVSYGTECSYEWKVLTPATPFVEGTQAKVCTVCGDIERATKESIAKTTIAAPAVKTTKNTAKVTVKAVEGAVQYQVLVNGKVKIKNAKVGKNTVKKLKANKKYKFQVRAINADGVKATSKAKKAKTKKK